MVYRPLLVLFFNTFFVLNIFVLQILILMLAIIILPWSIISVLPFVVIYDNVFLVK